MKDSFKARTTLACGSSNFEIFSLAALKDYTIQVGGHTDQMRVTNPETQERFPTNWELSTARATQVLRQLYFKYPQSPDRVVVLEAMAAGVPKMARSGRSLRLMGERPGGGRSTGTGPSRAPRW